MYENVEDASDAEHMSAEWFKMRKHANAGTKLFMSHAGAKCTKKMFSPCT